jgi:hypothetical protein
MQNPISHVVNAHDLALDAIVDVVAVQLLQAIGL